MSSTSVAQQFTKFCKDNGLHTKIVMCADPRNVLVIVYRESTGATVHQFTTSRRETPEEVLESELNMLAIMDVCK